MNEHTLTPESLRRTERYRQEEAERLASDRLQRQTIREDEIEQHNSMKKTVKNEQKISKRKPNKELAVGQTLPRALQTKFPAELIGIPIEEIDWYYRTEDVFMVVNRNKTIFRFSSTPACFIFSPFNLFRRFAIRVLTHSLFSTFVMLTILTNCIFMTLKNIPDTNEYVFTTIYTLEALTKCVARGFILKKFTFLRDPWNWLDFIVITLAYVTSLVHLGNVSVLRTFRVLRALKTVAVVPGLKTIVDALIQSLICLRDVTVLACFILSIFALVGLQLYTGILRQKCVLTYEAFLNNSNFSSNSLNMSYSVYEEETKNKTFWYQEDDVYVVCGNATGSRRCPDGYVCLKKGENPDFGYTSFDSYGWAMLSCFRLMTQDYWENLYQLVLSAAGRYHFFYFVAVIFFGSFYLVNLILAIVSMSYQEQQQKVNAEKRERERRKVEDELEQQNEETRKASELGEISPNHELNLENTILFENLNRQPSLSSLSVEYDPNLLAYDIKQRQSAQTSPLFFDDSSCITSDPTMIVDERQSYDTIIPFLDDTRHNSINTRNGETSSRQRTRTCSRASERLNPDNQSTVTLYQPKTHVKYAPVNQVLSRTGSDATSVPSKKQHTVLQKVNRPIDDLGSSHVECRLPLTANEHARQSQQQQQPKKRLNIVISDMESTNLCDRPFVKFLWSTCFEWNCPSPLFRKFQAVVGFFILDAFVDLFITICILLNTLFMALDQPGQSDKMTRILTTGNYVFTGIFTTETFLKIIAKTPAKFLKDGWNVFDLFIVTLSLVELGLENVKGLSVLRSFRLLRVFKLAKSWPTLNRLMSIIGKTIGALGNLTLVLVIIIFIFAVMGMQLFGPDYDKKFGKNMPRWNFFDFFHAFMIVFRVLCGEWIESMWVCLECAGYSCIPFFLFTFVIGNLVVLNLFLALLLASFGSNVLAEREKDDDDNKIGEAIVRIQRSFHFVTRSIIDLFRGKGDSHSKIVESLTTETIYLNQSHAGTGDSISNLALRPSISIDNRTNNVNGLVTRPSEIVGPFEDIELKPLNNTPTTPIVPPTYQFSHTLPDCCPPTISKYYNCCQYIIPQKVQQSWTYLRTQAHRLVEHRFFEWLIIASILASSATLALEDINTRQQPTFSSILHSFDKLFTIIFTTELVLKWFAYGIRNYFTNGWNWLDFLIVVVSVLGTLLDGLGVADIPAFKSMRTLRALRPLKALSRFDGIRVVVNALIGAIPSIFNVLLVCLVFWLIFSIVGVQLFGGRFYKCVYVDTHDRVNLTENVTNKIDCLNKNFTWENSRVNFDNVLNGYLALFQIATFKGWIEIMADAADAKEIDVQPEHEANVYILVYFVLFIIFGSFFTLNLFIGVVIDNFNQQKRKVKSKLGKGGSIEMFMTDDQKKYYNAMKKMGNRKPTKALPRPRFPIARFFFDLTTNQTFEICIMVFIFLNMLCMCLEYYGQPDNHERVLGYINNFFVAIFTVECGMKLLALHYKYFTIPWNVFDFIIVLASILGQALSELLANYFVNPTLLRVVRVARVGRVLRLVKGAKGIRTLLFALAVSMPALFNIGLLLFLVMFIYSIFGMSFFGYVRKAAGVTEILNFETFPNSLIILFQMCTTAGWSGVLQALTNDRPPDCDPTLKSPSNRGDCGSMAIAIPFLVTYLIISSLVVVNMYIAVILENFSQAQEDVQQGLTDDDYDMYYEKWQSLDPSGSQFIRYDQLSDFVDGLEPPLRIPKPNQLLLVAMDLPICAGDRMHCVDILDGLTKYFLGSLDISALSAESDAPIDIKKDRPRDYRVVTTTLQRQRENYLGRLGLRGFLANVERCRLERQSREPILERITMDELIELDDLGTPSSTVSRRSKYSISRTLIIQQQQPEGTLSDTSSLCSFEERSLC